MISRWKEGASCSHDLAVLGGNGVQEAFTASLIYSVYLAWCHTLSRVAITGCLMLSGENFTLFTIVMTTSCEQHGPGIWRGFLWLYHNMVTKSEIGRACVQKGHMCEETRVGGRAWPDRPVRRHS